MKAILKFDLPEETEEFMRTTHSLDMAMVLFEITYNLRKRTENEFDFRLDEKRDDVQPGDVIDYIFKEIWAKLEEHDIVIDNLIS